ncbi:MAG: N-acetylmuramoyl-L-alanine amidase [Bdellovibrionaceae bacterium]|jgi:N-acetylmuramoyl-L-alanine amidase|nr:N-acetylmuramoyl-L-alanine amidase [Pseudobdellovibrionaceae bacterium]
MRFKDLSFVILTAYLISFSSSAYAKLHIIIDPGHGGSDKGANYYGIKESDITLSVAKKLHALITKDNKLQSSLLRSKNNNLSLPERVSKAQEASGDLYISIHVNANRNRSIYGPEFYFQSQLSPDKEALYLAGVENQELSDKLRIRNWEENSWPAIKTAQGDLRNILFDMQRISHIKKSSKFAQQLYMNWQPKRRRKSVSLRQAPFYVISNSNMPSVLIELGYITNKKDMRKLRSKGFQSKVVKSIYNGIKEYQKRLLL